MKIIYLTTGCFDKGGISRYNRYQITALRELVKPEGVRVFSLHGKRPDDFEEPFEIDFASSGTGLLSKIRFALYVFKNLIGWRPEVIWVGHVNLSGMAYLLSRVTGAHVILNTYGLEVWSGLTSDAAYGLRKAHTVISDCYFTAKYLEEMRFRSPKTVKVIWDCVDLRRFYPKKADISVLAKYGIPEPERHQLIVTLGRISRAAAHKGYDRLIKAFAIIQPNFPKARLVLAGKGDWMEELKAMASQLSIADKVVFTGMVEERHLVDIYRSAYVFSLASDRGKGRGEGIPLTPLEAMACGAPVIVGNQDGSQEAVMDSSNGFIIDPFDIENHAKILARLLSDIELHRSKSEAATRIAREHFSYDQFREKHKSLLYEISSAFK